jgi:hypothetical protein
MSAFPFRAGVLHAGLLCAALAQAQVATDATPQPRARPDSVASRCRAAAAVAPDAGQQLRQIKALWAVHAQDGAGRASAVSEQAPKPDSHAH